MVTTSSGLYGKGGVNYGDGTPHNQTNPENPENVEVDQTDVSYYDQTEVFYERLAILDILMQTDRFATMSVDQLIKSTNEIHKAFKTVDE